MKAGSINLSLSGIRSFIRRVFPWASLDTPATLGGPSLCWKKSAKSEGIGKCPVPVGWTMFHIPLYPRLQIKRKAVDRRLVDQIHRWNLRSGSVSSFFAEGLENEPLLYCPSTCHSFHIGSCFLGHSTDVTHHSWSIDWKGLAARLNDKEYSSWF